MGNPLGEPGREPEQSGSGSGSGWGLASGLVTTGAALGSAALQRSWAKKDLAAQNLYNSPAEQIKRLKEAGLPLASMFTGSGGSQSDQPRSSQVDPTLGVSEGLSKFFMTQINKRQIAMMDADIRQKNADASVKEGESKWLGSFAAGTAGPTNQQSMLQSKKSMLEADEIIKDNQQLISNIETEVESELRTNGFRQLESRLADILQKNLRNTQIGQDIDIVKLSNAFKKEVVERLEKQEGLRGILGKIIYGFMYGQQRIPTIPGQ